MARQSATWRMAQPRLGATMGTAMNTIITHDAGSPRDQISPFWQAETPLSYIGWGKTTQLGYGLGLAMGAKLAAPDKLCINVWGDAAIGFTGMDFETAVRERIPILSILLNNFCIAVPSNEGRCSQCHPSYGWKDDSFDLTSEENVDCLVCHDTTGLYSREALRTPGKRRPKLEKFAQQVGPTSRRSCGTCHFAGGGAKAVKHGDIDPTLVHPDYFVDVHMDAEGLNFSCSTCHTSDQHEVRGSRYSPAAADEAEIGVPGTEARERATCRACHGSTPHPSNAKLNDHTDRIACQTCHIPFMAFKAGTKLTWDWSQAGQDLPITDAHQYLKIKGRFTWVKGAEPEYAWYNGTGVLLYVSGMMVAAPKMNKSIANVNSTRVRRSGMLQMFLKAWIMTDRSPPWRLWPPVAAISSEVFRSPWPARER